MYMLLEMWYDPCRDVREIGYETLLDSIPRSEPALELHSVKWRWHFIVPTVPTQEAITEEGGLKTQLYELLKVICLWWDVGYFGYFETKDRIIDKKINRQSPIFFFSLISLLKEYRPSLDKDVYYWS